MPENVGPTEECPCSHDAEPKGIIVTKLAELPEKALLDERALAEVLGVTKRTIRRMVRRHELPPPFRVAGRARWFAGKVLDHFKAEAERRATKARAEAVRLRKYTLD